MAKDCGCNGGKASTPMATNSAPSTAPSKKVQGIITKQLCPKCNHWMSLVITPSTKEKTFKCQSIMCNYSMPYSQPSASPSPLPPL
jgi:hypothetical protein